MKVVNYLPITCVYKELLLRNTASTRGIQKVLRQILKNTLFMKFTKLFFYIVSIQFITSLTEVPSWNFSMETSLTEVL